MRRPGPALRSASRLGSIVARLTLVGVLAAGGAARAAPLDALLDLQTTPGTPTRWQLEAGRDLANDRLDVFGWRQQAGVTDRFGNYAGQHLRLGVQSGPWAGELIGWRRHITDHDTVHRLNSWQVAVQREFGSATDRTRWGLRLSAWGNQATVLTRSTSALLIAQGIDARLGELQLHRPRDRQWQLDAIGRTTLPLSGWSLSGFAGAGRSLVTRDSATATAQIAGCTYLLDFGTERLTAEPPPGCTNAPTISVPNRLLPFDAMQETRYRSTYVHLGGALRWRNEDWRLALGAEWQQWQREGVDERIEARGGTPYTSNQILIGELQYRFNPVLGGLLRAQLMRHQFVGELPMIYNGLTVARFSQRYGIVTAGLVARF